MILQVKYLYKSALYECIYKFPSDLIQKGVFQPYNDMKMDNLFLLLIHFIFMLIGEYYWVRKTWYLCGKQHQANRTKNKQQQQQTQKNSHKKQQRHSRWANQLRDTKYIFYRLHTSHVAFLFYSLILLSLISFFISHMT